MYTRAAGAAGGPDTGRDVVVEGAGGGDGEDGGRAAGRVVLTWDVEPRRTARGGHYHGRGAELIAGVEADNPLVPVHVY